jgi:hypothetical protein
MTIINGIEIDDIDYKVNDIKYAITNNNPIENKLHVIIVISNPCLYARRYILCKEFIPHIGITKDKYLFKALFVGHMIYKLLLWLGRNNHIKCGYIIFLNINIPSIY